MTLSPLERLQAVEDRLTRLEHPEGVPEKPAPEPAAPGEPTSSKLWDALELDRLKAQNEALRAKLVASEADVVTWQRKANEEDPRIAALRQFHVSYQVENFTVCYHCCTNCTSYRTETCINSHDHTFVDAICPTAATLDGKTYA